MGQSHSTPPSQSIVPKRTCSYSHDGKTVWVDADKDDKGGSDVLCNILLVGNTGSGKSLLLWRLEGNKGSPFKFGKRGTFTCETQYPTIGVDFRIRRGSLEPHGTRVDIRFWDTAGQERFRTITSAYYRGAKAIILCFNVSDRASFESIEKVWIKDIHRYASDSVCLFLVGLRLPIELVLFQHQGDMPQKRSDISLKQLCAFQMVKDEISIDTLPPELREYVKTMPANRYMDRKEAEEMASRIGTEYIEIAPCSSSQSVIDGLALSVVLEILKKDGGGIVGGVK